MKTIYLLLFLFLTSSFKMFAQLPMNSGIVYYKFEETFQSKSCIANYFLLGTKEASSVRVMENINKQLLDFTMNKNSEGNKSFFKYQSGVYMIMGYYIMIIKVDENCLASSTDSYNPINLTITLPTKWAPLKLYETIGIGKKVRITQQKITVNPVMEFIGKDKYVLKFKGIMYSVSGTRGNKYFTETRPLGEVYEAYLNDSEKSKVDGTIFEDIDKIFNLINDLTKKELKKAISVHEID